MPYAAEGESTKGPKIVRLYVPGGEGELLQWLAALERCCGGRSGEPHPAPLDAVPVAVV